MPFEFNICFSSLKVEEFSESLDSILIKENGLKLVPELYTVPAEKVMIYIFFIVLCNLV